MPDTHQKAPLLRIVEQLELAEREWEPQDAEGQERATVVYYRPTGWADEEVDAVVRLDRNGGEPRLLPALTVILVIREDLPQADLVRRHRGKQGQENALKGPLRKLCLASSAMPLLPCQLSLLRVWPDRAAAAAGSAIPDIAGGSAGARAAAVESEFGADGGATGEERASEETAVRAGQLPAGLAATRRRAARAGLG